MKEAWSSALLLLLWFPSLGEACPLCSSETASLVRAEFRSTVTDPLVWLAVLLPFGVTLAAVRFLHSDFFDRNF